MRCCGKLCSVTSMVIYSQFLVGDGYHSYNTAFAELYILYCHFCGYVNVVNDGYHAKGATMTFTTCALGCSGSVVGMGRNEAESEGTAGSKSVQLFLAAI